MSMFLKMEEQATKIPFILWANQCRRCLHTELTRLVWVCCNSHDSNTLLMFTPRGALVSNQLMLSKHF